MWGAQFVVSIIIITVQYRRKRTKKISFFLWIEKYDMLCAFRGINRNEGENYQFFPSPFDLVPKAKKSFAIFSPLLLLFFTVHFCGCWYIYFFELSPNNNSWCLLCIAFSHIKNMNTSEIQKHFLSEILGLTIQITWTYLL